MRFQALAISRGLASNQRLTPACLLDSPYLVADVSLSTESHVMPLIRPHVGHLNNDGSRRTRSRCQLQTVQRARTKTNYLMSVRKLLQLARRWGNRGRIWTRPLQSKMWVSRVRVTVDGLTWARQILKRDADATEKAPKVLQDDIKNSNSPSGSRSYSTSAWRSADGLELSSAESIGLPPSMTFQDIKHELGGEGHKFGMPRTPLARTDHFKRRYDPVVEQLSKILMKDGKLATAQRVATLHDLQVCRTERC